MVVFDPAEFSNLIGLMYDAAVARDEWGAVLDGICKLLNAQTAALWSYDVNDRTPPWQRDVGYNPHWKRLYTEKYLALNPYMDDVVRMSPGEARASSSRPDFQNLLQTEFYQGWLKPQRFVDASVLIVEKSMNNITTLVNVRNEDQGLYDVATIELVKMLYPHLRRAVMIDRLFREQEHRAAESSVALDSLAAGMFVLTDKAVVVHANTSGSDMLADDTPMKMVNGRFVLADEQANRFLRDALAGAREGDGELEDAGASIPLRGEQGDFVLHLLPLNAARRALIASGRGGTHVLFVSRSDPQNAPVIATFARRFGLTAQETRVLHCLVEAGSVPMAAEILGISSATARSHVTRIFDKSGVRRQADVLRLLMEMRSPFAN